jgi:hypothetical protein
VALRHIDENLKARFPTRQIAMNAGFIGGIHATEEFTGTVADFH